MIRVYIPMPESYYYDPLNDSFYYMNRILKDNFDREQIPIDKLQMLRFLKGLHPNRTRFEKTYLKSLSEYSLLLPVTEYFRHNYQLQTPFSLKEALKLENRYFRTRVLSTIQPSEFISEFDSKRLNVAGKRIKRKVYNSNGDLKEEPVYDSVFETYEIDVSAIRNRGEEYYYALKVWCTSTKEEHWLWIEEKYKDDPLQAIASTFHIHQNLIPHIKEIKRQGDVLLVELNKDVEPIGGIEPMTKEQYFGFLTSET